jgi:hypothetical protein
LLRKINNKPENMAFDINLPPGFVGLISFFGFENCIALSLRLFNGPSASTCCSL